MNHKFVYRLYRADGLKGLRRRRKRLSRENGVTAAVPQPSNRRWSMDFVSDCLAGGRPIRSVDTVGGDARAARTGERYSQARPARENRPEFRGHVPEG